MDSLAELSSFNRQLGTLTRPAVAEEAGLIVGVDFAKNGLLGSDLAVFDREGEELQIHHSLQGLPAVDPAGRWIYLLRAGDVWVLHRADLALVSVYVPDGPMPHDLAVSPDGRFVYFFSPQELAAVPARTLQTWGIPPAPSFPSVATQEEDWPRLLYYPSPSYDQDEAAFVLTSDCGELYRSQDGGRSWQYLPDLFYPDTAYIHFLSVSPDFALDRTLVASGGDIGTMWRSVDAGDTWQAWRPPLAFVSERDGSRDIYTMDADGQQVQRRTANPAADENPAWSPAWTRIAFQSDRTGNWDIFSIKAGCTPEPPAEGDECDLQQLTDDPADDVLPAWSPDGRFIAFVSTRDGNPELYLMPSQGGAARRLTFDPAGDWRPAWLPDSQRLHFTSGRSGDNDIFMLRALPAGAEPELTLVAGGPSDERDPAVNRSSQPLFLSDRDGVFRPYYVRNFDYPSFSSINPLLKAIPEVPDGHPAWVDDGLHTILVASERAGDSNVYRVEADRSSPQGVRYSRLAASPAFDGQPAWGPAWWQSAQALPE